MAELKDRNYISIQAFMVKDLGLKGNELITYALIYGFSQDGENYFRGSLSYIAEWLNCSKNTAYNIVKSLVDKGFLDKKEKEINKVKFCEYMAVIPNEKEENKDLDRRTKILDTHTNNCDEGVQKTCINNILNNLKNNNNSKDNSFSQKKVINQDEFIIHIHNVIKKMQQEVLDENQADNLEQFFIYFIERYAEIFERKHPFLSSETLHSISADLTQHTYIDHNKFVTHFNPLVSDFSEDDSYKSIVDLYFETEFKKDIDYSLAHFCQKNVLTKLMGHDTSRLWFTNES